MGRRSLNLIEKLDAKLTLTEDVFGVDHDVNALMEISVSPIRFDSKQQFEEYLTEGALLNINALASRIIGIPVGEYLVHSIADKTILIPRSEAKKSSKEMFLERPEQKEIYTNHLLGAWNTIERTIAEDAA